MRYKFTEISARQLEALNDLRNQVRPVLGRGSLLAQDEWANLERRLPSVDEITLGFIGLSEDNLAEILSKTRRFRDILRDTSPADSPISVEE